MLKISLHAIYTPAFADIVIRWRATMHVPHTVKSSLIMFLTWHSLIVTTLYCEEEGELTIYAMRLERDRAETPPRTDSKKTTRLKIMSPHEMA